MRRYNEYGNKKRQNNDREDKAIDYKNLLFNENSLYSTDKDLIAYYYINNKPKIAAFLELTRIEKYPDEVPPNSYFESILARYRKDSQKEISDVLSNACNAPTVIVAMSLNLNHFYLYNLTKDNNKWYYQDVVKHLRWHYSIRNMNPPDNLEGKYAAKNILEEIYKNG